jgi:hypothetical protein
MIAFKKPLALALALCVGAAAMPMGAMAQPAPDNNGYQGGYQDQGSYQGYDDAQARKACEDRKTGNTVAGVLVGGVLGAVVGSQVSGHGARTEGSVLGGGAGAIAGGAIGNASTNCDQPPPPPPRADWRGGDPGPGYAQDDHYNDGRGYDNGAPPPPPPGGYDERYSQGDGPGDPGQGCDWADSTVYMPDGTTQKHLVHVCEDAAHHWVVVE